MSGTSGKNSVELGRLSFVRIQFGGAKPGWTSAPVTLRAMASTAPNMIS